ncbi:MULTISPECIES: cupin domain-containing protein [unclassified Leptolyngbya]|uniref:cupin domain-containing protein n=1 Tax=unclassified Leptolyngbya TaxID=2650499 RepID=UPI001682DF58|nr:MULTISPECIES: cupin domain-containing protein [unclassified Leptolyngbya]MBD1910247.1 cupin domain-containing protein [Leptolyngbya sp. FACHB-8]MBD2156430.1 cupin domain-containing protein [Leptolyngbya sp. FACHB-16]
MTPPYNKAHFDFANLPYLTSPRRQLNLQGVALGLISLPPDEGYTFTHTHAEQEEVYIVIEGNGFLLLNGELVSLEPGDIVRVSPATKRALKAASLSKLLVICVGAVPVGYPKDPNSRYMIDDGVPDYDDVPPWYAGRDDIATRNATLKERMLRAEEKRRRKQSG